MKHFKNRYCLLYKLYNLFTQVTFFGNHFFKAELRYRPTDKWSIASLCDENLPPSYFFFFF